MVIRGVAFDVDGTLYSNARFYLRAIGYAARNRRLLRHFRRVRRAIRQIEPIEDFHDLQARMLSREMGVSEEQATRLIRERLYRANEDLLATVPLLRGARAGLALLRERGLRLAAASDFPIRRKLEQFGLEDAFDCAYCTEDTGYLKPNSKAFAPLSECLRLPPDQILYVGNSYDYDVLGASAAGFLTAHLSRTVKARSVADVTFYRYDDLLTWIMERVPAGDRP